MLKALMKKELLTIFAGVITNRKTNKRRSAAGIAGMALLFLLIIASIGMAFVGYSHMFIDTLVPERTWLYMALIGLAALILGLFGSVFSTYSALYKAKDNEFLLSMPIPAGKLLASKMLIVYLTALLFTAIAMLPGLIVYWANAGSVSAASVIFSVLLIFLLALFTTALSCILGWLVALVVGLFPNKQAVSVIATLVFLGVYYFFYFRISKILQSMLLNISGIEKTISSKIYPVYKFGQGAAGDAGAFLIFALIAIVVFAIVYVVLSRSFVRILTRTEKQRTKVYVEKQTNGRSVAGALLFKEFRRFLGSAAYMLNGSMGSLLMILAAVALIIFSKDISNLLSMLQIAERSSNLSISKYIPLAASALLCFLASSNILTAPSISLEAKTLWLTKSLPVDTNKIFDAKIKLHVLVTAVPAALLLVIAAIILKLRVTDAIYCAVLMLVFVYFCASAGLAIGIKMPNMNWTNETIAVKQGGAVFLAMFGGWVLLMALGALYGFVLRKTMEPGTYLRVLIAFFLVATLAVNAWLKGPGIKRFKEL